VSRIKLGLIALALTGCGLFRPPVAPKPNEAEAKCIADVEAREDVELLACGKDTSGACSTDAIMDRYDVEADQCLKDY
jgi:hypothetical protein